MQRYCNLKKVVRYYSFDLFNPLSLCLSLALFVGVSLPLFYPFNFNDSHKLYLLNSVCLWIPTPSVLFLGLLSFCFLCYSPYPLPRYIYLYICLFDYLFNYSFVRLLAFVLSRLSMKSKGKLEIKMFYPGA